MNAPQKPLCLSAAPNTQVSGRGAARDPARLHLGRTAGCHCHHRRFDCVVAAGRAERRESARRISCTNNLKQVGLSLLEYVNAKQTFPPAQSTFVAGAINSQTNPTWAWSYLILPYMDQQALYRASRSNLRALEEGDLRERGVPPPPVRAQHRGRPRRAPLRQGRHRDRRRRGRDAHPPSPHLVLRPVFPELIAHGKLFILETPLFRVRNKKETHYCYSDAERAEAVGS